MAFEALQLIYKELPEIDTDRTRVAIGKSSINPTLKYGPESNITDELRDASRLERARFITGNWAVSGDTTVELL